MPPASGRLIAIGDIHGCVHALDALVDAIGPMASDTLVFLGDLIDQGPNSREVLECIIQLQAHSRVVLIRGNHEEMLFAARDSKDEQALRFWENCGGVAMLNSYRFGAGLSDIPDEHWSLLEGGVPYFETGEYIFTHANYLPETPMTEQPSHQLRWALFDPEDAHAHISGKPVTVGHTEQRDGEILDLGFAACIDTACWRYGWLTALDRTGNTAWQASRWGVMRQVGEPSHREPLAKLLRKTGS
jgi:serine/threonine protein phosphatase 1